eukprot:8972386-Alexandrium_andersonii.AAC.1
MGHGITSTPSAWATASGFFEPGDQACAARRAVGVRLGCSLAVPDVGVAAGQSEHAPLSRWHVVSA